VKEHDGESTREILTDDVGFGADQMKVASRKKEPFGETTKMMSSSEEPKNPITDPSAIIEYEPSPGIRISNPRTSRNIGSEQPIPETQNFQLFETGRRIFPMDKSGIPASDDSLSIPYTRSATMATGHYLGIEI
jgi:hypothetical protein